MAVTVILYIAAVFNIKNRCTVLNNLQFLLAVTVQLTGLFL